MLKDNMEKANKIREILNKISKGFVFYVEPYTNGREQGWSVNYFIKNTMTQPIKQVSFSQNRNDNNIVVYFGLSENFMPDTNISDEATYKNAKYFKSDEYEKAALFIFNHLITNINDGEEKAVILCQHNCIITDTYVYPNNQEKAKEKFIQVVTNELDGLYSKDYFEKFFNELDVYGEINDKNGSKVIFIYTPFYINK